MVYMYMYLGTVGVMYMCHRFAVLIDDIHGATSVADDKIRVQTRRVEEVRRKDSCKCACGQS